MKPLWLFSLIFPIAILALASPPVETTSTETHLKTLKLPGPKAQDLLLGKWSIESVYAPTETMPNGDKGRGSEFWHAGPAGRSVIEIQEKSGSGLLDGIAVFWWDEAARGERFLWCDNTEPHGCYVSKGLAKWDGDRLIYTEDVIDGGKSLRRQEIFSDITATSFTQVVQVGPVGGEMKAVVTTKATRVRNE